MKGPNGTDMATNARLTARTAVRATTRRTSVRATTPHTARTPTHQTAGPAEPSCR